MLEGLEINELRFSEIYSKPFSYRIDSEPHTFKSEIVNPTIKQVKLSDNFELNPSKTEIEKSRLSETEVSFVPMSLISSGYLVNMEEGLASQYINSGYTYFRNGDVLIATITPCMEHGKCFIANSLKNKIGFGSTELVVLREKQNSELLKEYLIVYLNRDAIRNKAASFFIGTSGRQRVPSYFYRNLIIPIVSHNLQIKIKELYDLSLSFRNKSKQIYQQAEQLLLQEVGLADFTPSQEPVNVKSFSESFGSSRRLDAEYYQVKYDDVENKIASYKYGFSTLGAQIDYIKTGEYSESYTPKSSNSVYYLRNNNISKGEIIPDENYSVDSSKFQCSASLNEVLTSRVGTIGLFGVINKPLVGSVYSDNVLCFKLTDELNPFVYSILFSSEPYQQLLEKLAGGSVQPLITQTSIKTLIIPIIEKVKQQQIATLVDKSFTLKRKSEHLLEIAKQAVEMAIEESEEVALDYLKSASKQES